MYKYAIKIKLYLSVCLNIYYLLHESVKLQRLQENNILNIMKHFRAI